MSEHENSVEPPIVGPPRPPVEDRSLDAHNDPLRFVIPVNPSAWAIASGYLGLFSVLGVFAPFALFTGIMAILEIKRHPEKTGIGRARFGIVMGAIFTVLFLAMILEPVWRGSNER